MKRIFPILIVALLSLAGIASAANICVSPSGSGSGSGADWNNTASWSSLTFVRGNTYYLMDGAYAAKEFDTPPSGSTYIYIRKAINTADCTRDCTSAHGTDTGWQTSYGDDVATFSQSNGMSGNEKAYWRFTTGYWDVSGQKGGGYGRWKTGHGFKIVAQDGVVSGVTGGGKGILIRDNAGTNLVSYFNISHVEIEGIWDGDIPNGTTNNYGVYIYFFNHYINLSYLYIHDMGAPSILWNHIYNVLLEQSYVANNQSTQPLEHGTCIALQEGYDVTIRNNIFYQSRGTTRSLDIKKNQTWETNNVYFYGNIVDLGGAGGGAIGDDQPRLESPDDNLWVFNNTFLRHEYGFYGGFSFYSGGTPQYGYNNIFYEIPGRMDPTDPNYPPQHIIEHRGYNWYYHVGLYSGVYQDQIAASNETNGVVGTGNPFTNIDAGDYSLSGAISGYDMTGLWAGVDKLDMAGHVRGQDGVWDRGALEYVFGDTIPDQFIFEDVTDASRSTQYTSNTITVAGIDTTADVSISGSGCEYSKNSGSYTPNNGTAVLDDTFTVRVTSSASYSAASNCTLDIGGRTDTYTVTTTTGIPSLVSPGVDETGVVRPVTFSWNAVPGAQKYNLQVDDDSDFSSPIVDIETTNTSYEVSTLSSNTTYYWRVNALQ